MDSRDVWDLQRAVLKRRRGDISSSKDLGFLAGVPRVEAWGSNSSASDAFGSPSFTEEQVWTFLRAVGDY